MPVPTENRECKTVDEVIAGAEEWGDTEILSEDKLRGYCQRMLDAADDFECEFESNTSKNKKIRIQVYHPNFIIAGEMADLTAGGYGACNALLQEIFRQRKIIRDLEAQLKGAESDDRPTDKAADRGVATTVHERDEASLHHSGRAR